MEVLTPAADMPWTVASPFRMQPGLGRLPDTPTLFRRDAMAHGYAQAKREVLAQADHGPVGQTDDAVLQAIADAYHRETDVTLAATVAGLTQGMQEDFVVLADGPDGFRTRLLSVCFPSSWVPADKLGLDFAAIHAPVADNTLLLSAARGIMDMAFRQAPMVRHVWLLSPDAQLSQHPARARRPWSSLVADAGEHGRLIDLCCLRVERQTTLPLPALGVGVFFIRVMVAPLAAVLALDAGRAAQLHAAIASMSDAVLNYRGMAGVRERLLCELAQLALMQG
ncbi:MAG: DUF3445 domain-containing protein [Hydrogenophaga sp.]|uniref:heme-dependent oxidative N-demethylase subunit alpha family protein n=1 Tax=Hydrogenophaga sp. TaxID=1904254 RepID=UPI001DFC7315|nr:heme-dependent oxidative N-demethylase subunit alpha family protein [Hydrogenophaga sp.]MBX3609028.1 DUF3445 domain-containing protein [Hydrogenophaga sp.]